MSYAFSRRDFLKYSALTAVAVAGAGLLTGCEVQDPSNPMYEVGKKISIGNTTAQLTLATENTLDGNFKIRIANGGDQPLYIEPSRFTVSVTTTNEKGNSTVFYNSAYPGNSIVFGEPEVTSGTFPNLPKKGDVTLPITATNFKVPETGSYTMIFQYIPVGYQSEMSLRWKMVVGQV